MKAKVGIKKTSGEEMEDPESCQKLEEEAVKEPNN